MPQRDDRILHRPLLALLPHLLVAGINIFWLLECAAGMDPLEIHRKFGRAARLMGGIDKIEVAKGKEAIRREMSRKIPPLLKEGGYIPAIDHSVGTDISFTDYRCYMETLKEIYEVKS